MIAIPQSERTSSSRRILVVDDNPDVRETLADMLTAMGHLAVEASDGVNALAVAAEFRHEVVIVDLGLPDIGGYEVARRLRQQRRSDELTIVVLTGWGSEEDLVQYSAAVIDGYAVKPIGLDALRMLVGDAREPGEMS